ncbi:MAG: hypothetical protein ACRCXZ_00180 [Patescibacteria group bacterium]
MNTFQILERNQSMNFSTGSIAADLECSNTYNIDLFAAATTFDSNTGKFFLPSMNYLVYYANPSFDSLFTYKDGLDSIDIPSNPIAQITAFADSLPPSITDIIFGATLDPKIAERYTFRSCHDAFLSVNQIQDQRRLKGSCKVSLTGFDSNGLIIGKFTKSGSRWIFTSISTPVQCNPNLLIQEVLHAANVDVI